MDFTSITDHFVLVVLLACLGTGYIIKTSFLTVPNRYIPTILAVLGATLNVIMEGLSVDSIVYGGLMGLASTGMYEAFKNYIEHKNT